MIFQTEGAIDKIIAGTKTQTRRLVKPGDCLVFGDVRRGAPSSGRYIYQTGADYAVQPGRGKPGVWWNSFRRDGKVSAGRPTGFDSSDWEPLRIRILSIRREDVRSISREDALAEGGYTPYEYLLLWSRMHDKTNVIYYPVPAYPVGHMSDPALRNYAAVRPDKFYAAWVLIFEVVQP